MPTLRLQILALLALFGACIPTGGTGVNNNDGLGVEILDDGFREAGPAPDAGTNAGEDAGLFGDAGAIEYNGEPEDGVRCGQTLEACGGACCVDTSGFPISATCNEAPPQCFAGETTSFSCDGPEDCVPNDAGPQVCCVSGGLETGLTGACTSPEQCFAATGTFACTSTATCPQGLLCCGFQGIPLPVDLGICAPTCELDLTPQGDAGP